MWLRNGLGGYHGRCNWCRDKLSDPTAIYAGMPDSMKVPWQQHLAEIRMVDTEMKSFQDMPIFLHVKPEFEAFLHEFSGAGPLSIKEQRFFDPYVAFSGQVRLERRSLSDILSYLLNYSARNPHYEEARRSSSVMLNLKQAYNPLRPSAGSSTSRASLTSFTTAEVRSSFQVRHAT
eukprot:s14_g30.t1